MFETLPYSNVFMQYEGFCNILQTTIMALQKDVSKVNLYNFVHYYNRYLLSLII